MKEQRRSYSRSSGDAECGLEAALVSATKAIETSIKIKIKIARNNNEWQKKKESRVIMNLESQY